VTERASQLLKGQAGIIEAFGDKVFDHIISQGITLSTASSGTASNLLIKNADYLMEGKGHPIFIKNFKNLPSYIQVLSPESKPKRCSKCGKMYHTTLGELATSYPHFDICEKCR
ncbi:MAG: hypothetical protein WCY12_04015, partial [Candidatus Omnitrophota bacterium]